jgi:hypothetical protein
MVYDPIRDREVSHAGSEQLLSGPGEGQPDAAHIDRGHGYEYGQHGLGDRRSSSISSSVPASRTNSLAGAGLRGLLNEESISRRSSDHRSSISSTATYDDQQQQQQQQGRQPQQQQYQQQQTTHQRVSKYEPPVDLPYTQPHANPTPRQSLHRILNDTTAPPLSKTNSGHSSSPHPSPGPRSLHLENGGFLTPGTPASGQPRGSAGSLSGGRSGRPSMSPGPSGYPPGVYEQIMYEQQQQGYHAPLGQPGSAGPSRRASGGSRPSQSDMPPPLLGSGYEYGQGGSRGAPSGLPLRSPSVSVSPRVQYAGLPPGYPSNTIRQSPSASMSPQDYRHSLPPGYSLPSRTTPSPHSTGLHNGHPLSRPTSSASAQAFSYQVPSTHVSPYYVDRRLSDDHSPRDQHNGRRSNVLSRQSSGRDPGYSPRTARSPSPIPISERAYQPNRITKPQTVLLPYDSSEIPQRKSIGLTNNPLRRRRKVTRPLPSWSGPSPGARTTPNEDDSSYFPVQNERKRSASISGRVGTSVTPGAAAGGSIASARYPPGFEERAAETPGLPKNARGKIQAGESGNGVGHLKRASTEDDGGRDTTRRKVSETQYVGNASTVASHC